MKSKEVWFSRQLASRGPRLRLFCLPYAGGGASIYRTYSQSLPDDVEVCAVQLPGRERRFVEPALESVSAIADELAPVLGEFLDLPYAIFGHSLGALVGFELVRRLQDDGRPLPVCLFESGHRAPHLPDPDPPIHHLPEAEFVQELRELNGTPREVFESAELLQLVLPMLRADFTAAETYIHTGGAPLQCPITVLGGTGDSLISREALEAWKVHTTGEFALHLLEGDHFFIHERHADVTRILRERLARC